MGASVPLVAAQGDWSKQVKEQDLRRKLRKKAKKLARFAKRNGFDDLSIGAYLRVMPAAYVTCDMDGKQYHFTVPLGGEADA